MNQFVYIFLAYLILVLQDAPAYKMPLRFSTRILRQQMHPKTETAPESAVTDSKKIPSFVQDEMKPYAMKLHTRDQARDGQQPAQKPFTAWQPARQDYFQFLVDSLVVYEALDEIVHKYDVLLPFRQTGLERAAALKQDIAWMKSYDPTLLHEEAGPLAVQYAQFLRRMASESIPKFMCHYYNHYFAHTAGGRMIGKKMCDMLLEGQSLKFYEWEGDVKVLIEQAKHQIDLLALTWSPEEKQQCLEETLACFKAGGEVMAALKPPAH